MEEILSQSGLIIEVPEAEPAVGGHRDILDANARLGVPAHLTVLFPFMPPAHIDWTVYEALGQLFGRISAFDFRLTHTGWFGDDVLWLGPEDAQPFRALTELVQEAFPDYAPFKGQFADVIPHLTIAHRSKRAHMEAAGRSVEQDLPIVCRAHKVTLIQRIDTGDSWSRAADFALRE